MCVLNCHETSRVSHLITVAFIERHEQEITVWNIILIDVLQKSVYKHMNISANFFQNAKLLPVHVKC
jgi:hypothetical protein